MIETRELIAVLENLLSQHFDKQCHITSLERHRYPYRSTYELEEFTVYIEGDPILPLLFKNLSRATVPEGIRDAKPLLMYDPRREIETYRIFVPGGRWGTAICYGSINDERAGNYWLFLEKVLGKELYQVGEFEQWKQVARWLAKLHAFGFHLHELRAQAEAAHLLNYDGEFYAHWLQRARVLLTHKVPVDERSAACKIEWLLDSYAHVIERLVALPVTFIHGEFYASNVLVQETDLELRVCPVDWELAAIGPGLMDLATLTSGSWSEDQQTEMAYAYYSELSTKMEVSVGELLTSLDCCRLHLAIQWLGWSAVWSPPPQHGQDWLAVGLSLAEKLAL